jgi:hypothetical protein
MSKTFSEKNEILFDVGFSSVFLVLCCIAVSGVCQRWEFKNTTKNVLQTKSCRKAFTKKSTKNPKPIFSIFLITFLGVSRWGEFKNTIKKIYHTKNLTLVLFWPPTNPPTTGVTDCFLAALGLELGLEARPPRPTQGTQKQAPPPLKPNQTNTEERLSSIKILSSIKLLSSIEYSAKQKHRQC